MATGNGILGTMRRKLGDVVWYRAGGQQRSRVRVTPKNPQSAKQAVQRMVLATAAKMASAYKPIVDHSFESVLEGVASVNYFRRRAMEVLRNSAAYYIGDPTTGSGDFAEYVAKGVPTIGMAKGILVSQGSLFMNEYSCTTEGVRVILDGLSLFPNISTLDEYARQLGLFGLEPGDQLTVVQHFMGPAIAVADNGNVINTAQAVRFARIVFKTLEQIEPLLGNENPLTMFTASGVLDERVVFATEGSVVPTKSEVEGTGKTLLNFKVKAPQDYGCACGCLIRSKKLTGSKYAYSTATLAASADDFDYNNAPEAYPSYMAGATPIEVGDRLYLQHAEAALA